MYQRNKRELLKDNCLKYLGGKICNKCEVDYLPTCCYEFHHVNGNKEFEIARYKKFDSTMKKELDKCKILCRNCHAIKHNI